MAVETFAINSWTTTPDYALQQKAIAALEAGKVVYMPDLPFQLHTQELLFLTPDICDRRRKNVSYDLKYDKMGGICKSHDAAEFKKLMQRYALYSRQLLLNLFPQYAPTVQQARTSYRPVEIAGRAAPSYRKDDTRLHVDSFPATPTQGKRILRVFTNVNPHGQPRVWRVGEDFANVVSKFAPRVKSPLPGSAWIQKICKITRSYRTMYDHYMLNMHNLMKGDQHYQQHVAQQEVKFPPGSTWIVFTDQVSHAAMAGQYVFEQTFYVPSHGLQNLESAPVRILENFLTRDLI